MTYEEATERIEYILAFNVFTRADKNALKFGIKAVEKQIPKKPYIVDDEYKGECCMCSNCDEFIVYKDDCKLKQYQKAYCPNCGQAIDWGDVK